jgi:hypothetical protein
MGNQPATQPESILRDRLEKSWSSLGEALSNIRSINGKLFSPSPCNTIPGEKISSVDTSSVENLVSLIETAAQQIEMESRQISNRI